MALVLEILCIVAATVIYTMFMYWAHRLNSEHIVKRIWHHFSRGEADHHKGVNTGAPFWIHFVLALLAAGPFCWLAWTWTPLIGTVTGAVFDRGWHHVDHMYYHHRLNVNYNYGLGPGFVWDKVFGTLRPKDYERKRGSSAAE